MERQIDIHKAAGILIQDRKFLVSRSRGKNTFISPGGKLHPGETSEEALVRELREELAIEVDPGSLQAFGTFYAQAAEQEDRYLRIDVFLVLEWRGTIQPSHEIEEVLWIDSTPPFGLQLGSIFQHEVLPRLKEKGMIS